MDAFLIRDLRHKVYLVEEDFSGFEPDDVLECITRGIIVEQAAGIFKVNSSRLAFLQKAGGSEV